MFRERVSFKRENLRVSSQGLLKRGQADLAVSVDSADLLDEAEAFLRYVVAYLDQAQTKITAGQTLNYGYLLVEFPPVSDRMLKVWELDAEGTQFVKGGSLTLRYWRDQHAICDKYKAAFSPPNPEELTVVSASALEIGRPVQAVRYRWSEPMSGWMIDPPSHVSRHSFSAGSG